MNKSIVVYLKSPRRRREKAKVLQRYTKYRCVPQIASTETRTNFSKKTYYSAIQRDGPTGSTRGGCAASPAIRNCYYRAWQQNLDKESVLARYRCVPKIASPEARKSECTTAPHAQIAASPGAEPSAGRMYYGATEADRSESGR